LSARDLLAATDFYVLDSDQPVPEGLRRIPQVSTEQGPAFIALKKEQNGACIFLKGNLCMIHAVRPSVCAAFPFVFERKGRDMSWGLSAMKGICPGLGTGPQVRDSELTKLGSKTLHALSLFREFAEAWNKKTQTPTALGFLESVLEDARFSVQ
jgi:Fe-S-cluster containining protein